MKNWYKRYLESLEQELNRLYDELQIIRLEMSVNPAKHDCKVWVEKIELIKIQIESILDKANLATLG